MVIAACLLAAGATANAADHGFYFGGFGGQASYDFERSDPWVFGVNNDVVSPSGLTLPLNTGSVFPSSASFNPEPLQWQPEFDDSSSAWGAFAGYRIMRYAAAELGYQSLGTLKESLDTVASVQVRPAITIPVTFTRKLETRGPSISALGIVPISEQWSVYARAGMFFADMESTLSIGKGSEQSIAFGSDALLYGAGTQFDFGSHWSVRADFQRFDSVGERNEGGRADVDLLSVSVVFRL